MRPRRLGVQKERRVPLSIELCKVLFRVGQFKERAGMLSQLIIGEIELPENKVIGVKAYDLGGEVHYRPARYLIGLAIEATQSTLTKMFSGFGGARRP